MSISFRDIPTGAKDEGSAELATLLKSNPNIIMISQSPFNPDEMILGPSGLASRQIGFNDLPEDLDGVMRRAMISAQSDQDGKVFVSLSMRLAALYLKPLDITPKLNAAGRLQIGSWEFIPLDVTRGPYFLSEAEAPGNQYLGDFQNAGGFPAIRFTDAMQDRIEDRLVRGRVVLVGITAKSVKDTIVAPIIGHQFIAGRQYGVEGAREPRRSDHSQYHARPAPASSDGILARRWLDLPLDRDGSFTGLRYPFLAAMVDFRRWLGSRRWG